jgi:glycosyltransferase 2 family protein
MNRIALLVAKLAVATLLMWLVIDRVDPAQMIADISSASVSALAGAVLLLAFQPVLGAMRWHLIMRRFGAPVTPRQSVRLTYISTFLNQLVPGGFGGDAMRMWLSVRAGHQLSHALNGVTFDRLTFFLGLLLTTAVCISALDAYPRITALKLPLITAAAIALLATAVFIMLDRLPGALARFSPIRELGHVSVDARMLFLSRGTGAAVLLLSLVSIANLCGSLFLFMVAFNVPLLPSLLAASMPPIVLASSLPITIGGWGTRETAVVVMLTTMGTQPEPGVIASIAFGLAGLLISVPGAFYLYGSMPEGR